jgi:hypothetical protein
LVTQFNDWHFHCSLTFRHEGFILKLQIWLLIFRRAPRSATRHKFYEALLFLLLVTQIPFAAADMNGDLKADLLGWNQSTGALTLWPSDGSSVGMGLPFGGLATHNKIFIADFTGDRKSDLIGWDYTTGQISLWPSTGFSVGIGTVVGRLGSNYKIYFADVTGDAKADLIGWNQDSGTFWVWPSTGNSLGQPFVFGGLGQNYRIFFADITGDGKSDLVGWNQNTGAFAVWPSTGFGLGIGFAFGGLGRNYKIYFGDVTGDRKADLVGWNQSTGAITAWPSTGTGVGIGFSFGGLHTNYTIHIADVSGDGKSDLVGWNPTTGNITVWPSSGSGIGVGFAFGGLGSIFKMFIGNSNDDQLGAALGYRWPLIGTTIHTVYVPSAPIHWDWYKNSSTYWEFSKMQPTLGFYDQTVGSNIQQEHYNQLQRAKVDYGLISWFGGINDPATDSSINKVLETYVNVFIQNNQVAAAPPIKMAFIMEFAGTNYQTRLNYLKSLYDKFQSYQLKYNGLPVIELSFDSNDPFKSASVQYAKDLGFYVVDSDDAAGGGATFGAITLKTDDPNRITSFAGGVSPGIDITGKSDIASLGATYEAEKISRGCGTAISDASASGGISVLSTGSNCNVVSTASNVPTQAQYASEWYAIFRVKTSNIANVRGNVIVEDSCGNSYSQPLNSQSITVNNQYAHIPVQFLHLQANCSVTFRVAITSGDVSVDRIWMTTCEFRKPSIAEFDSQWQPIKTKVLPARPAFITVGSFNGWEEGSSIEANSVFGSQFLDRTSYWVNLLKAP